VNNFTVLLVDDVEENIHSLKLMIEDTFDVTILTALSAQDAMATLMKKEVDLILTDVQMPDIDGFEFAEYLNGIERTKDIPLIFITGIYDKTEYQKKGYKLGAIEYITKPIDDVLLNAKLKIYIDLFDNKKLKESEIQKKDDVLKHQAKMATMGEMIGVISHQMKQPLNVLSLYCDDVKDSHKYGEIDDDFVKDFSKNTKEQIKFLSNTIDGFRNFFNPDKNKKLFSLKECVTQAINLIETQIESNNIKLNIDIDEEKVYGVMTELEQVILNLITNAKDAFIERNIQDRMINITSGSSQQHTFLVVEDNAGGIKTKNIDDIFNPYFTTKEEGTGTGLYMVKLVVKTSFNGELNIENKNEGAKFSIALPNQVS